MATVGTLQFRAGRMNYDGKIVAPDKRKGLIHIYLNQEDSLNHFTWKDRTTGAAELDLIIFPEDATFKRIPKCTTGRVYLLEYTQTKQKYFFWLQEPKTDKDDEIERKVNQSLNGVEADTTQTQPTTQSTSASTSTTAGASTPSSQADLQRLLIQSLNAMKPQQQPEQPEGPSLSAIMNPDALIPILTNPSVVTQLRPFLPEELRATEDLVSLVRSPQFQQSLEGFSAALQTGQIGSLMSQFNLDPSKGNDLESFLLAIQSYANGNAQNQSGSQSETKEKQSDTKKEDKMDES